MGTSGSDTAPLDAVDGYLRYSAWLCSDPADDDLGSDADESAYTIVDQATRRLGPEASWSLTLAVVSHADSEQLSGVAVGPLETMVRRHGAVLVDAIESEAARSERFKWALGLIWLDDDDLPADILRRIVA